MRKTNKHNRQKRSQANAIAFSTVAITAIASIMLVKNYGTVSVPSCNVYTGDYNDLIVRPVNELYDVTVTSAFDTSVPAETTLVVTTTDMTTSITSMSTTEEITDCVTTSDVVTEDTTPLETTVTSEPELVTEATTTQYRARPEIYDCPLPDHVQEYIYSQAKLYSIDYELIMAIIKAESNYDQYAYSGSSHGLMQINNINYSLAVKLGVNDLYDACGNVLVGTYLFNDLLSRHTIKDALICYNVGEYAAEQQGLLGTDTAYTDKVLEYYYDYTYHTSAN